MPKINTPKQRHRVNVNSARWEFKPFTDKQYLKTLKRAMDIIDSRIKGHNPCNEAFKALPGGKSFADIWKDQTVWINYDSSNKQGKYGATHRSSKNITISRYALRMGRWTVAATLVHELAHVNGAPGDDTQAEDTLKSCLLNGLHDPTIIGKVTESGRRDRMVA